MRQHFFRIYLMTAILVLAVPLAAPAGPPSVDLKKLSSGMDNWTLTASEGSGTAGYQLLENSIWAMFFIHWDAMPDPAPELDEAYLLERVRGIWGDKVADFATESSGKGKIHGNKTFFVEGLRESGSIRSRYTIFLCPDSKRIFITEIDLFTALGTSEAVYDVLLESERCLSCTGENRRINNPKVPRKMNFPAVSIICHIPDGWRSDLFGEESSEAKGSAWTLPVESSGKIRYSWESAAAGSAESQAGAALEAWKAGFLGEEEGRTATLDPDGAAALVRDKDGWRQEGVLVVEDQAFAWDSGTHHYRIRLWEKSGTRHCVVYSILGRESFWEERVYLAPDSVTFNNLAIRLSRAISGFPQP